MLIPSIEPAVSTAATSRAASWSEEDLGQLAVLATTLDAAGVKSAGAGRNAREAAAPAIIDNGAGGRVLVFAIGSASSGIPRAWTAGEAKPGLNTVPALDADTARELAAAIAQYRRPADVVVLSVRGGDTGG